MVLITSSQIKLDKMIDYMVVESDKMSTSFHNKKTEVILISKKRITPRCTITVSNINFEEIQTYSHLGRWIAPEA